MIGAGWTNHTVCYGDSGGPLTVSRARTVQVGVASLVESWPHDCGEPGGYAELNGPQLAWLASVVPSIVPSWGPCTTSAGTAGVTFVSYYLPSSPTSQMDGQFAWFLTCSTPQKPPPPPHGPSEQVCLKKPWLCDDN